MERYCASMMALRPDWPWMSPGYKVSTIEGKSLTKAGISGMKTKTLKGRPALAAETMRSTIAAPMRFLTGLPVSVVVMLKGVSARSCLRAGYAH